MTRYIGEEEVLRDLTIPVAIEMVVRSFRQLAEGTAVCGAVRAERDCG